MNSEKKHAEALKAVRSVFDGIPAPCAERDALDFAIALLARTEAGADGAVPMNPIGYVDLASWQADLNAGESFFTDYQDEDTQPIYTQAQMEHAIEIAKATHPQDASGDAVAELIAAADVLNTGAKHGLSTYPEDWKRLDAALDAMQAKEAK